MKRTTLRILFTLLAVLMITLPLHAEAFGRQGGARQDAPAQSEPGNAPTGNRQPGGDFIADFDRDGDGQVSAEEFPGPEAHFSRFDQDGDGFISESEKPQGPPPGHSPGSQAGDHFSRLDQDQDGQISRDEFPGPDEHFQQFDVNGDGYLDVSEAPQGPPPRRGSGRRIQSSG